MRTAKQRTISIMKRKGIGDDLPSFIKAAHRHCEKSPPLIQDISKNEVLVPVPTDMMRLTLPDELVNEVDSLDIIYRKR